jgi:hypothetical protein
MWKMTPPKNALRKYMLHMNKLFLRNLVGMYAAQERDHIQEQHKEDKINKASHFFHHYTTKKYNDCIVCSYQKVKWNQKRNILLLSIISRTGAALCTVDVVA